MSTAARPAPATGVPATADILVSAAAILSGNPSRVEQFVDGALSVLKAHYAYYELLLIDNGLPVEVHLLVQQLQSRLANVRLLRLSRRYSTEVALAAALDHCIGDYVVLLDPEAHSPELIPQMVERARSGCDSVVALPRGGCESFLDRTVVARLYGIASKILGFRLRPDESYYSVFSRRLVNSIVRIRSKNRYLSYLNASIGLRECIVYYESAAKPPAPPAARLVRSLTAIANILVSNSAIPLRFASALGLMASGANLAYLGYILAVTLVKSRIAEGWLTTSLTQASMFLVLFLILTILSEYIARILDETKEQPLYFVESESYSTISEMNRDRLNVIHTSAEGGAGSPG